MAPPKYAKNTSGAMALAWSPPSLLTTAMSCWLNSANRSTRTMSPTIVPYTSKRSRSWAAFPPISRLMPPLMRGRVYQTAVQHGGIAAVPLNQHGHPVFARDGHGVPLCPKSLRMQPTYQFAHTNGYRAQRYRCPLLFPHISGQTCDHEQFAKGKGCVKDINIEPGGLMRSTLDRSAPLYKAVYTQRTSTERINSQAQALGIERPKVRNSRSVRNLNTLTYLVINAKALQRARSINASLLTPIRLRE